MREPGVNKYGRWFCWSVFAGILQDWFFALPGIFYPNTVLGVAQTEPATQPIWPAYACMLLILLSIFYIPGALNPIRNASLALFTVVARLGGVIFFFLLYPGQFPAFFGYIDLTLTLLQGSLLFLTLLQGPDLEPAAG
jgi:hypothetical protein